MYLVDARANKHQIKQAVRTLCDMNVAKVNALIRAEGQKKAYVWLTLNYDALDVAYKTGII